MYVGSLVLNGTMNLKYANTNNTTAQSMTADSVFASNITTQNIGGYGFSSTSGNVLLNFPVSVLPIITKSVRIPTSDPTTWANNNVQIVAYAINNDGTSTFYFKSSSSNYVGFNGQSFVLNASINKARFNPASVNNNMTIQTAVLYCSEKQYSFWELDPSGLAYFYNTPITSGSIIILR